MGKKKNIDWAELKKSWVFQENGEINQYKEHHQGTQPVRVIHHMLLFMFANSHREFTKELQEQVDAGRLNPVIAMIFAEEGLKKEKGFHTPRVHADSRQISIHETFLSYLWCLTYSIYVLYIETVDYPAVNKEVGYEKYIISTEEIKKAKELFDYAKSMIAYYSAWDKTTMPNPENYLAEKRNYVEQTNLIYTEAMKFILGHEFTHLKRHIDQIDVETPDSQFLVYEREADEEAIVIILKGRNEINELAVNAGILVGVLAMLFFSSETGGGERHPDTLDRVTAALESLEIGEDDYTWGLACVGLSLWEEQFNISLKWLDQPDSPEQQFYHLIEQIKNN
jgi:hypothetical protein